LNHFTVPVAIRDIFLRETGRLKLPIPARGFAPLSARISYGLQ
jgi:hypothetical protein